MNSRFDTRRQLLASAAALPVIATLGGLTRSAQAQVPQQSKIILGFAPGGGADLIARILADKMREGLPAGTQIVVENKAGAGGKIAVEALRASAADGGTMLLAPLVTPVLSQIIFKNPGYNPATDMMPIGMVGHFQFALAVPQSHPAKNMADFVIWLKANKEKANFGSPSPGSLPHFFGIMLGRAVGVDMVHVAYKGGAPMLNDLMGGQIACGMDTHIELIPLHQGGKIRILASFADKRSALIPDVPTMAELGFKDATGSGWYSLWAPAKTPVATIAALNKALNIALENADVKEKLARTGTEPATSTPEGLEKFRLAEIEKWRPVIVASGFKAD
ncbi:MAG: Twin-arginine translocation pathway signal [Rhizobacter sp.]|nr:Twin-arginine translocation pathway signal [Burkholderiales bacterium]